MSFARGSISERALFQIRAVLENLRYGIHESIRKGEGLNFAAIREYEEGESLKRVDWMRSLERSHDLDELMVREFEPEKQMHVVVMLDARRGMHIPRRKGEMAVALSWLAALSAFKMRDTLKLIIAFDPDEGGVIASPYLRGEEDLDEFFRAVAAGEVPSTFPNDISAIEVMGGSLPNDTFVVVISDFEQEGGFFAEIGERLAPSRHGRLFLLAVDGWEGVSPIPALLSLSLGRDGRPLEIDARAGGELDALKQSARRRQHAILESAWKRGHLSVRVPVFAERPFDTLLNTLAVVNS